MAASTEKMSQSIEDSFEKEILRRSHDRNLDADADAEVEQYYLQEAELFRSSLPKPSREQLNVLEKEQKNHKEKRKIQDQSTEVALSPSFQVEKACAIKMFNTMEGFANAIKNQILPQLIRLETSQGIGTGFFQHTDWLVSNAHVIPDVKSLEATTIVDFQKQPCKLEAQLAFHRPFDNDKAPDIVIVKTKPRGSTMARSLPVDFNGDESIGDTRKFYLYFDPLTGKPKVSFLKGKLLSKASTYPMIYALEDGSEPPFGCSGAPILEARVALSGKNPEWQFKVLGVVYGRCSPEWYDSYENRQGMVLEQSKLLCIIPVLPDFEQIRLSILIKKDEIERAINLINSCSNSPQLSNVVKEQQLLLNQLLKDVHQNIMLFKKGATHLKIDLPEGLEKLVYSTSAELLAMKENEVRGHLSRAGVERREQLIRSEEMKKKQEIERLKASIQPTSTPFTDKFKKDHVSNQSEESLKVTQSRVSQRRSYANESGEKESSVMRISEKEGQKELKKIAETLTTDDLVKTQDGGYQIKKGTIHTTEEYLTASASVVFSREGRRKVGESTRTKQKAEIVPKIDADGQLKIHHFDRASSAKR